MTRYSFPDPAEFPWSSENQNWSNSRSNKFKKNKKLSKWCRHLNLKLVFIKDDLTGMIYQTCKQLTVSFQTVDNRQHRTMILWKWEVNEMSHMTAEALYWSYISKDDSGKRNPSRACYYNWWEKTEIEARDARWLEFAEKHIGEKSHRERTWIYKGHFVSLNKH